MVTSQKHIDWLHLWKTRFIQPDESLILKVLKNYFCTKYWMLKEVALFAGLLSFLQKRMDQTEIILFQISRFWTFVPFPLVR